MKVKRTTEDFILESSLKHNNEYDYSKTVYVKNNEKVCIICPEHGEFWQTPHMHLMGQGCPLCSGKGKNTKYFIREAREIHGDKYDYSKSVYRGSLNKLCIICPEHGEFLMPPNRHISQKQGCPLCGNKCKGEYRRQTTEGFIENARKIHGDKYDYSKVIYIQNKQRVEIICPIHGSFFQRPNDHLNGSGCPACGKKCLSEDKICNIIEKHFPDVIRQYVPSFFTNASHPQTYDAYIPSINAAVEYQGRQHFKPLVRFGGEEGYRRTKERDERKFNISKENGVTIVYFTYENPKIIPDVYFDKIYTDEDELLNYLQSMKKL